MEILLPRINYAHEIVGTHGEAVLPERAPGAKPRSKTPQSFVSAFMLMVTIASHEGITLLGKNLKTLTNHPKMT